MSDGPKTPKASGSYEIAGARVVWCREIALAAGQRPGAEALMRRAEALADRFEAWLGPRRFGGEILSATTAIEARHADMEAWKRLLADARRLGVAPF